MLSVFRLIDIRHQERNEINAKRKDVSQNFPGLSHRALVTRCSAKSVLHSGTHFCSAPCAVLSRECTVLVKMVKTPKSWSKEINLASFNPVFSRFMSPQSLLNYNTHQDPAELEIWNMLGVCLYKQCKHTQAYTGTISRETKSLRGNQCLCRKTWPVAAQSTEKEIR